MDGISQEPGPRVGSPIEWDRRRRPKEVGSTGQRAGGIVIGIHKQGRTKNTQIYSDPVRFGQTQRCAPQMELLVGRVAGGGSGFMGQE